MALVLGLLVSSPSPYQVRIASATAIEGRGLEGDSFPLGGYHIAIISQEALESLLRKGVTTKFEDTKCNILVENIPIESLVDKRFKIGEAVFLGMAMCWIGFKNTYSDKIVLGANVVQSGYLRASDQVTVLN